MDEILNRLSLSSVAVLKRINPSLVDLEFISAADFISALVDFDPGLLEVFTELDLPNISSQSSKKIVVSELLLNAYREAFLVESDLVDVSHLILAFLLSMDKDRYYLAKKKLPKTSQMQLSLELRKFVVDLNKQVDKDKEAFFGREHEIARLIANLSASKVKPTLLVGGHGSGRTSLMYELARRINQKKVPMQLANSRVLRVDFPRLMNFIPNENGSYSSVVLSHVFNSMADSGRKSGQKTILFLDDLNFGANMFIGIEPTSEAQDVLLVGAAHEEIQDKLWGSPVYKMWDIISLNQPSEEDLVKILKHNCESILAKKKIKFTDKALKKIVELFNEDLSGDAMPGSGLRLLESIGVFKRHTETDYHAVEAMWRDIGEAKHKKRIANLEKGLELLLTQDVLVDVQDVEAFVVGNDQLKEPKDTDDLNTDKLIGLESDLAEKIIGQDDALESLSRALRISSLKLDGNTKPVGSFLFLGPTGVGKTETAKVLARVLYGYRDSTQRQPAKFMRIDMTEYSEKHSVSRLFGAPPGYVGYDDSNSLADFVSDNPSCVVLFDEIDKAHPDVLNSLLHIMDEGEIRTNTGDMVSFEDVIIVMTSNHGAELIGQPTYGFGAAPIKGRRDKQNRVLLEKVNNSTEDDWKDKLRQNLKKKLKPEFLNRFDDIIVFNKLDEESLLKIIDIMLSAVTNSLAKKDIKLTTLKKAKKLIAQKANSDEYGARDLRRVINKEIIDPVSKILLTDKKTGKIKIGTTNKNITIQNLKSFSAS
mgnify:CR=1 FL=1